MLKFRKSPFITIAWSNYLFYIMAATIIWGLFPLFLHYMEGFPSKFPSAYLLLRYLCTGFVFIISLVFLFRKNMNSVWVFIRSKPLSFIYGGIVLFMARYFETLAFEYNIVTFTVIFSVAFVPLMEPVVVFGLYRPKFSRWIFEKIFGKAMSVKMASITGEKENYWLEYAITLAIVFSTAMFFIYGMEGNFNIFSSDVPFYAYGFVLLAAAALQLYFHSFDFGFEGAELDLSGNHENEDNEILKKFGPSVIKQSVFALIIAFFSFIWNMSSDKGLTHALKTVEHPGVFFFSLLIGIVFFGSVVAYVCDNLGFDGYKKEKESLPFKIRGVEWLGISTLMDPLVSNILTAFCPFLAETGKEGSQVQPVFFGISLIMILLLMVLKVLIMRYSKLHEFKVFCFSNLRSQRTSGRTINPDHFSSVALIRNPESIRSDSIKCELIEILKFNEADVPENELQKHLQYQLWLFNSSNLEVRKSVSVWIMKNGKLLYSAGQLFERLLFHEHMRSFCVENHIRDQRVILFYPDKLRFDENRLVELINKETGSEIGEDDQVFYFMDLPGRKNTAEHIRHYITDRWNLVKDRNKYEKVQNEVMMEVLTKNEMQ
ncbi:Uncharacterized protein dnl_25540 [Desulfonema limicola]|uniref:Uncharacterized protein n=1 Tax=Desulfonema limicola TaxID=45656 RepID=A0A975B7S9_9BACT|nr:hypothetical protein [Desulfonema limicola]QTA80258.1 Uncharacterized protein dnl_25540 [Desulfonema limicola]